MDYSYTVVSGKKFNKIYKDIKMYKFLNDDMIHNNFEYQLGLNIDTEDFNPTDTCSKGGLYFCEESKCHLYWDNFGKYLGYVEIPNDAHIYIEDDKFKADKIILKKIEPFDNVNNEFWYKIIKYDGLALEYVKEQSEELCLKAVMKNGHTLLFVKEQTEKICLEAVKQDGFSLKYVREQTPKICWEAVKQNGHALSYVREQTEEICLEAVKKNGFALQYVKTQTPNICLEAVKKNGLALQFVKIQTNEICSEAVKQNDKALYYVNNEFKSLFGSDNNVFRFITNKMNILITMLILFIIYYS